MSATALARLMLGAAMLGGALICYSFRSHVDGVAAPLDQNRGDRAFPASMGGARADGPNS